MAKRSTDSSGACNHSSTVNLEVSRSVVYRQEDIIRDGVKVGTQNIIDHIDITYQTQCNHCSASVGGSFTRRG